MLQCPGWVHALQCNIQLAQCSAKWCGVLDISAEQDTVAKSTHKHFGVASGNFGAKLIAGHGSVHRLLSALLGCTSRQSISVQNHKALRRQLSTKYPLVGFLSFAKLLVAQRRLQGPAKTSQDTLRCPQDTLERS